MTTNQVAVRVRDLTKSYGSSVALAGIDLDIRYGETFALLGPNGAGKSTTVEILEGYRNRTSGAVSVLGRDPGDGDLDWKSRLGIVLQSSGEPGHATVREQLRHFAGFYPHPRDVEEMIAAVGLTDQADARIRSLSGGQRRRVDVALGIIGRPQLLFLDEPTTGFDPEARQQFWDVIRQLHEEGTTIMLTTHYLEEADQLSDRAAIVVAGRVVDIGPIDELGGTAARTPLVRWRDHLGLHEVRTTAPAPYVCGMVEYLAEDLQDLEVVRPSFEDVYLELIHSGGHPKEAVR